MTVVGNGVPAWLAGAQIEVRPALEEALRGLNPRVRRVCEYQLGWTDGQSGGGKSLRPLLTLASAEAAGGDPAVAMPAAVAVELLHNCTLLQDDVMDEDRTRRHRPAAWTVFGASPAILAGDALLALAFTALADSGHPVAGVAAGELMRTVDELVDGQAMDLEFERVGAVGVDDCLRMTAAKTGSLLACACRLGGLFGGGGEAACAALERYGRHLGLAYQLRDDLLGIWGDPRRTGKAALADLRRRKKSLPVVAALAGDGPAADQLRDLYARPEPFDDEAARRAARLVEEAGGREFAEGLARAELAGVDAALAELAALGAAGDRLAALGRFAIARDS
ncbi:polyprenyl synthetase family protein [Actinomycetes bacterium KLBMP 9797]